MFKYLKKTFNAIKPEKPTDTLAVYLVILKQTHENPQDTGETDYNKLKTEQAHYIESVRKLQQADIKGFPHMVLDKDLSLGAPIVAVCTPAVSQKLSELEGISTVIASPNISVREALRETHSEIRPACKP